MKPERKQLSIAISVLLLVLAAVVLFAERLLPGGSAVGAVRSHLEALRQADLKALERSASEAVFIRYQAQASEPTFEWIKQLYDRRIPRIAMPEWSEIRKQARAAAGREYSELRKKVVPLGRSHYQQLGPDERRSIIESGSFNQYIFEAGVGQLPAEERNRVPDARAFFRRDDERSYQIEQAWRHVPEQMAADLGSRAALLDEDSPEKLAYFDKVATPRLAPEEQQAIADVPRADVASLTRFVAGHGQRLLTARLRTSPPRLPNSASITCTSRAFERGALLHGPSARCGPADGQPSFLLEREAFDWRVIGVDGVLLGENQ